MITNYRENAETMRGLDLFSLGKMYFLDWESLSPSTVKDLEDRGYEEGCSVDEHIISELNLWNYSEADWPGEEDIEYEMSHLIKDAPWYLVMAHKCRWTGASGYKFARNRLSAISREYESSIYPFSASRDGKTLLCKEFSHDVPTGSRTTIIALTEDEYERLNSWNADWDTVATFVEKHENKLKS